MNYLSFVGWLSFMSWIIADTVPRYILPQLYPAYEALEELSKGAWGTGRLGPVLSLATQMLISAALAYALITWSAWSVLRCIVYTQNRDVSRALYFITGFICCEYTLGKIARADRFRTFFLSVLPYTMSMGAFIVFSMNYQPMKDAFPWLIRWMGLEL